MEGVQTVENNQLEQFVLLAKDTSGKATVAVLSQVLKNKNVYVFGEFRSLKCVQELKGTEHEPYLHLLNLFSYGTYEDYISKKDQLPVLTPVHITKLRQLSIVSYASEQKILNYKDLLHKLEIDNVRELEDLIISCVYAGLLKGKIDQLHRQFRVYWAMGRDLHPTQQDEMAQKLENWCDNAETLMNSLMKNIMLMKEEQEKQKKLAVEQENEFKQVKEALQKNALDDMESGANAMEIDSFIDPENRGKASKNRRNRPLLRPDFTASKRM